MSPRILWRMAWRTFWLQSAWNFQRLQNLGFAFALVPALRVLYPRGARTEAYKRHLEYFVTNPYCASLILGVVARLEQEQVQSGRPGAIDSRQLKENMMGPLAALGDSLFWATLKPGLAVLGISLVFLSPAGRTWPALAGPLVFLGLYTLIHLSVRFGGVFAGYYRGMAVIQDLRRLNPQKLVRKLGAFFAIIGGAVTALYLSGRQAVLLGAPWKDLPVLLGLSIAVYLVLRRGVSPSRVFYGLLVLALVAAFILER